MDTQHTYKEDDLNKPITLGVLLEYTDEFLIPKIAEFIKEENTAMEQRLRKENAGMEYRLKSYIDDKLADYTSDIFKRLDKKYGHEKQFKTKVVDLLRKHQIGTTEDIAYLEGLVDGV